MNSTDTQRSVTESTSTGRGARGRGRVGRGNGRGGRSDRGRGSNDRVVTPVFKGITEGTKVKVVQCHGETINKQQFIKTEAYLKSTSTTHSPIHKILHPCVR